MISLKLKTWALAFAALSLAACDDDDDKTAPHAPTTDTDTTTTTTISSTTIEANRFVSDVMEEYYYWNSELPNLDYTKQSNTTAYFYNLLSSKDKFSFITDDAEGYFSEEEGNYTSFGWTYTLSLVSSGSDEVVAIITQVFDNTPAAAAGARRGDVIYTINGTQMNTSNYKSLIALTSNVTFGGTHAAEEISYTMTAAEISVSPIAKTATFTLDNGQLAGYLLYNDYKDPFLDDLKAVFDDFKSKGVSEMILDLRYNHGGSITSEIALSSALAPEDVVKAHDPMMYYDFNKTLQALYPDYYARQNTAEYFVDDIANLNLSRLVVLCGGETYSAAEATIWDLKPFMDVVTIGSTTGGKNTMMYVLSPSDFTYSQTGKPYYSTTINNWLIFPIVAVYMNANYEAFDTTDGDGMDPDFEVNELSGLMTSGLYDLGDPKERLLMSALEYLNTGSVTTNKALAADAPRTVTTSLAEKPKLLYKKHKVNQ